ncbi:MAG: NAD(P)H-dependent glycerol-3-phosphate dehydrogenase [Polyangiaceae bacterium]
MSALRIAVLGAGNWGTTIAMLARSAGHDVALYTRDAGQRDAIVSEHRNPRALPGITLPEGIAATTSLAEALASAELVLVAIPSQSFRDVMRAAGPLLSPDQVLVHGTKGLENGSNARMSTIVEDETPIRQLGVLAGPNIAPEIARGLPAATVIASRFPRAIQLVRQALASDRFMVFAADDVVGVELAGALKNVVAIAAGMADEMAVGDNAKAFLVTRGLSELMRLARALGAEPATLTGLAGIGDLMVTCASPHSRNHKVGVALARGEALADVVANLGMVAEGVFASRSARALAEKTGIEMPLYAHIDRVLAGELTPTAALSALMRLPSGRDTPGFLRPSNRPL